MTTYDITALVGDPFWSGPASAPPPGSDYDITLDGTPYLIDWVSQQFRHQVVQSIRAQADSSQEPGEQTLNPEDLWLRGQTSWHGGAGQRYFDLADPDGGQISSRRRFRTSKGVDPWTYGELKLLPATSRVRSTSATNVQVAVAGSRCYFLADNELRYSTDLNTWTQVTAAGAALSSPVSMHSDGFNVWVSDATNLYYTTRTSSTYAQWHQTAFANVYLVRVAKGRLFTAVGSSLYNNTAQGTAHPNSPIAGSGTYFVNNDWRWTDVCEGPAAIYASGYAGDKSRIYMTSISEDNAGLSAFKVAGELPDGETVRSMCGYLGGLLIGTDRGVRFAALDQAGNIAAMGDLIKTGQPVLCFEPQDRFVWFGAKAIDASSSGLGRIDLRTFSSDLTPAWAYDIFATNTTGQVNSVATFGDKRVFAVEQSGLWAEQSTFVTAGTLTTGWINYGMPVEKTAVQLDVAHAAGAGEYTVGMALDHRTTFDSLGATVATVGSQAGQVSWSTQLRRAETFEIQFTLSGSGSSTPVLKRWTLRSQPAAIAGVRILLPLVLHERELTNSGKDRTRNVQLEKQRIFAMRDSGRVVVYREGDEAYSVVVEACEWSPVGRRASNRGSFDGTMVLQLKVVTAR